MKVVAIDKFEYASKLRLPGDEFETDNEEHAKLLQLAKRVKIIERRDMQAEDEISAKRKYRRRDMKADE